MRGAMAATPDGGFDLLLREGPAKTQTGASYSAGARRTRSPAGPSALPKTAEKIYLLDSRGANASRLVLLDLESERHRRLSRTRATMSGGS